MREGEFESKKSGDLEKHQLASKISTLTNETERLSAVIQQKMDESKQLALVIIEKDRTLLRFPQIEERNNALQQENARLTQSIRIITEETVRKLSDENAALRNRLAETSDFERTKNDLETKILFLNQERERYSTTITVMSQEKLAL